MVVNNQDGYGYIETWFFPKELHIIVGASDLGEQETSTILGLDSAKLHTTITYFFSFCFASITK